MGRSTVADDFNAKHKTWGSKKNDDRETLFLEWAAQHNLVVVNESTIPTYVRRSRPFSCRHNTV